MLLIIFFVLGATSVTDTTPKQLVEVSQPTSIASATTKPAMLALFKQGYPKSSISGIVQISDQQSYQAQPVTLTILNSPSMTTSTKGTICLTNTSTYGNILMKSDTETATSDVNVHSQSQSHNILNTVVVSSTTPTSHGSIQYLVPNLYVPQSDIQIPVSGMNLILYN